MRSEFSEFSFGFAYTHELTNLWASHLSRAPEHPSLQDEGKPGGGYDLKLDAPGFVYCAQFKLSQLLTTTKAKESGLRDAKLPYLRFGIYGSRTSQQHEMLMELERPGILVEYVAPLFIEQSDLDSGFKRAALRHNVLRLRPSVIGPMPDNERHSIVFDEHGGSVERYSEPKKLVGSLNYGPISESGFPGLSIAEPQTGPPTPQLRQLERDISPGQTVRSLLQTFVRTVAGLEDLQMTRLDGSDAELLLGAQNIARVVLGAELFVLPTES